MSDIKYYTYGFYDTIGKRVVEFFTITLQHTFISGMRTVPEVLNFFSEHVDLDTLKSNSDYDSFRANDYAISYSLEIISAKYCFYVAETQYDIDIEDLLDEVKGDLPFHGTKEAVQEFYDFLKNNNYEYINRLKVVKIDLDRFKNDPNYDPLNTSQLDLSTPERKQLFKSKFRKNKI